MTAAEQALKERRFGDGLVRARGGAGRLNHDARLARKGLQLRNGLTFEAWMGVGRRLAEVSNASAWWLGDWIVYGHRAYGQRYRIAVEATALDYQTLRNYAWVARRFEVSRRREALSFQHHTKVTALAEAEQDLWLGRAESLGWSRNELRRRMFEAQQPRALTAGRVTCRLNVAADREERWRRAAATAERSLAQWMIEVVDAAADAALPRR